MVAEEVVADLGDGDFRACLWHKDVSAPGITVPVEDIMSLVCLEEMFALFTDGHMSGSSQELLRQG